jgi:nucleoside-diphosphate-sugar epimerase
MRVLITGGTGFIGSRLALHYLSRGDSVKVLGQENTAAEVANSNSLKAQGADVILASVANRNRLFEVAQGVDLVYHFAAAQHEANVPDQHFWDVNVTGTRNLLEASVAAGVQRFVHGSTIGVYGSSLAGVMHEQSPVHPDNIYGRTKLEGEKLVLSFQDKLPVVVIRISETYGPGDYRLLKLFKAIQKRVFFMIGNGRNMHHLIYIDDLIDGFILAGTVADAVGQLFVLAGKEALTTYDMVTLIAEHLGTQLPKFRAPLAPFSLVAMMLETLFRPLGMQPPLHRRRMDFFKKSFVFSHEKSARILGFAPKVSFKEGVAATAAWYKSLGYL